MGTFKIKRHDHGFVAISRQTVRDERLSFRALGVLAWILDRPADWRFSAESMAQGEGREGRDAIRSVFRELVATGHMSVEKYQDEQGHWRTMTTVYEVPPGPENPPPKPEYPTPVRQDSVPQALYETGKRINETKEDLAPAVRKRDPVWDALMAVCGVTSVTNSARGAYNRATKDLRDVGAEPTEIARRGLVFRHRWPDASLTPTALVRHWGECDPNRQHAPVHKDDSEITRGVAAGFEAARRRKEHE